MQGTTTKKTPNASASCIDCLPSPRPAGFPLAKAQAYVHLRRPFVINDVFMQNALLDRRLVYKSLTEAHIPVPRHIVVSRDGLPPGRFEAKHNIAQGNDVCSNMEMLSPCDASDEARSCVSSSDMTQAPRWGSDDNLLL